MIRWAPGWIGGLLVFASAVAFDLGTLSAEAPKVLALGALGACGALALCARSRIRLAWPDMILLALLAWAALSVTWSPDPGGGQWALVHASAFYLIYLAAGRWPVEKFLPWAVVGSVITVAAITMLERWLHVKWSGGFGNDNFLAEYLALAPPITLWALWRGRAGLRKGIAVPGVGLGA